jgi:hypothetical protein
VSRIFLASLIGPPVVVASSIMNKIAAEKKLRKIDFGELTHKEVEILLIKYLLGKTNGNKCIKAYIREIVIYVIEIICL